MRKISKAQLVDYIYHNFSRKGRKIPKKELNNMSEELLLRIVEKNNCEAKLEAWVNQPKMIKFMVDGQLKGRDYSWDCEYPSEEKCREEFLKEGIIIKRIVPAKGHHRCKYCNGIAEGPNNDVLCEECRELFGHTYYSEL